MLRCTRTALVLAWACLWLGPGGVSAVLAMGVGADGARPPDELASGSNWCGTTPGRRDEERIRHQLNDRRLDRQCASERAAGTAPTPLCSRRLGAQLDRSHRTMTPGLPGIAGLAGGAPNIALIEDDGAILIPSNPFELPKPYSLIFTPSGEDGFTIASGSLRFETGGTRLTAFIGGGTGLGDPKDDGYQEVAFVNGFSFPFFGRTHDHVFVGTNGFLTFDAGDSNSPARVSTSVFVSAEPRIAPFWTDLDPRRGGIFVKQAADRFVVTWKSVPEFGAPNRTSTFQIQLFADGRVAFVYKKHRGRAELIGLSPGGDRAPLRPIDVLTPDPAPAAGAPFERFSFATQIDIPALAQAFYETHGDDYDFLYLWTDFPTSLGSAFAFYLPIRNDAHGIGQGIFDDAAAFGSGGRLQGLLVLNRPDVYPEDPNQVFLGLNSALSVFGQEQGHRWLAFARFLDDRGSRSPALLGRDLAHWSFSFNTESTTSSSEHRRSSSMEGNVIDAISSTRFLTVEDSIDDYSSLDQYLMGLRAPEEVAESFFVKGAGIGRGNSPTPGISIFGTQQTITVDDIIAAEGPRSPAYPLAQSAFRAAWILLVRQGTSPAQATIDKIDLFRESWEDYFNHALEGRGALSTELVP